MSIQWRFSQTSSSGLDLTLPQQQALERVQGPLAALGRIEGLPLAVLDRHVQEREHGREGRYEGCIQREQLAGELLADPRPVVPRLELKVGFEEVTDREIGGRLAIGDPVAFEQEPTLGPMGTEELVKEAGLPHPRLPDDRHELAVARTGLLVRPDA